MCGKGIRPLDFHFEVALNKGKQEIVILQVRQFLRHPIAQLPYLKPKIRDVEVILLHDLLVLLIKLNLRVHELLQRRVDLHRSVEKLPVVQHVVVQAEVTELFHVPAVVLHDEGCELVAVVRAITWVR